MSRIYKSLCICMLLLVGGLGASVAEAKVSGKARAILRGADRAWDFLVEGAGEAWNFLAGEDDSSGNIFLPPPSGTYLYEEGPLETLETRIQGENLQKLGAIDRINQYLNDEARALTYLPPGCHPDIKEKPYCPWLQTQSLRCYVPARCL